MPVAEAPSAFVEDAEPPVAVADEPVGAELPDVTTVLPDMTVV